MAQLRSFEVSRRIDVSIDRAWPTPAEVKARGLYFCPGRWSRIDGIGASAKQSIRKWTGFWASQGAKIQNTESCGDKLPYTVAKFDF